MLSCQKIKKHTEITVINSLRSLFRRIGKSKKIAKQFEQLPTPNLQLPTPNQIPNSQPKISIALDASRGEGEQKTGVEIYSQKIIGGLLKSFPDQKITLYSRQKLDLSLPPKADNKYYSHQKFFTIFFLQKEIIKEKPKLLFVPSAAIPFWISDKTKCITTIHDLAFCVFPHLYSMEERLYLKNSTRRAVKNCSRLIVPSQSTKQDLIKYFSCPPEKIKVINLGFDFPSSKNNFSPKNQFIFIGRIEDKKNLINTVRGFKEFLKKHKGYSLLLCGRDGFGAKKIREEARGEPVIKFLGFITQEEKIKLIQESRALLLPSFYEGFGLPILEAQSLRTPLICSDIPSNREIAGLGALFFHPRDPSDLARKLEDSLDDKKTQKIITEGNENITKFSWERCIRETSDLIREELGVCNFSYLK